MIRKLTTFLPFMVLTLAGFSLTTSASTPEGWTSDYAAAEARAAKKGQPMLLMFTGSDWCVWCRKLHQEILDTPTFMEWADENIILVYLDFPRKDYRSPEVKRQNEMLDQKYDISGYPTVILADAEGKELKRLGYMQGGPKTFIRAIERGLDKS